MGKPAQMLSEAEAAKYRRRAGEMLLWGLGGFLLQSGAFLLQTKPMGIALVLAAGPGGVLPAFVGASLGALSAGEGGITNAVILAMTLGARLLLSVRAKEEEEEGSAPVPLFREPVALRAIVALFAAFLSGVFYVIGYAFDYQGILSLLAGLVAAPILTALFWAATEKECSLTVRELGLCALLFCATRALAGHRLLGLPPALIFAAVVILQSAAKGGFLRGGVAGLITGLAGAANPLLLAAGGGVAGALRMFGAGSGAICFLAAAGGFAISSAGLMEALPILSGLFLGVLIYLPLAKSGILGRLSLFPKTAEAQPVTEASRRAEEAARLTRLATSFEELSGHLLKFSRDLARPGTGEMREICESVFRKHCKKCLQNGKCWQDEYESTKDALDKLAEEIPRRGAPGRECLPPHFLKRCRKIDSILADIGSELTRHVENTVLRDRSELFALDYRALSELLRESAADDGDLLPDEDLRKTFAAVIRGEGIQAVGCGAWGSRKKLLVASGVTLSSVPQGGRHLRGLLEEKTGLLLSEPSFRFVGERASMQFESRRRLSLTSARASSVKSGEPVSGDTARSFTSQTGYGYALICDGMGSGQTAASTASIGALFLEKLLSAGNPKSVTLKLLSNFIRGRAEECHSTVDLLEVDLYTGGASFVKCGACPSYVLREGSMFKVDVRSMPLGLTLEINAQQVNMVLKPGDVILQVSDGVAGSLEEALWLPEVFASLSGRGIQEIAGAIHARTLAEKGPCDDITVLVTQVESA